MLDFLDYFFFSGIGKNNPKQYKIEKGSTAINIFYYLLNLVLNTIKLNLEDSMDERSAKLYLVNSGRFAVKEVDGKLMNLCVTDANIMSPYGRPINAGVCDFTGKSYGRILPIMTLDDTNCDGAIINWSKRDIPPIYRIFWYTNQLLALQTSISTCVSNIKGTMIIRCEKEQVGVVKKAWKEANDGLPVIFSYSGDGTFGNPPEMLCNNPNLGENLKVLLETYDKRLSQFCSEFGINNDEIVNKLSGVSDNELKQNDERNDIVLKSIVNNLNEDFEKANKLFGTNMSAEIAFDRYNDREYNENQKEDEENGTDDISGTD